MARTHFRQLESGSWTLIAASLLGLVLALFQYFDVGDGIAYSPGALLVAVAAALILAASLVILARRGLPAWVGGLLYALIVIGLVGAAVAAYFLDSYWLSALMIVGLAGCLAQLLFNPGRGAIAPGPLGAGRAP
jgi:hypothetical protein